MFGELWGRGVMVVAGGKGAPQGDINGSLSLSPGWTLLPHRAKAQELWCGHWSPLVACLRSASSLMHCGVTGHPAIFHGLTSLLIRD